jgi:antitoxin HigA-1
MPPVRRPLHPGELIRYKLRKWKHGVSVAYLARVLGVSRSVLSRVMNGRTPIKAKLAVRLARAFKASAEWWLRMQADYDLWHARQRRRRRKAASCVTLRVTGQFQVRVCHA